MDNSTTGIPEKRSMSLSNGPSFRRSRPSSGGSGGGTLDSGGGGSGGGTASLPHTKIVVHKDEKGYGMKVSGDNPVYVQSVKEGGAAERAGLHSGDKIIKVNGVTVTHSTHLEVVELIKSGPHVELTVQQHPAHRGGGATTPLHPSSPLLPTMASPPPSRPLHHHHSAPARDRITGPQPVDYKKQVELENERLQMTRVMLEHEQNYVEMLRSNLARCQQASQESDLTRQLQAAERRVHTLQQQIAALTTTQGGKEPLPLSRHLVDFPPGYEGGDTPPPLPSRNPPTSPTPSFLATPPPLPPRQYLLQSDKLTSSGADFFLTTSSNHSPIGTPVHKHHRTKSSPDTLNASSMAEASKRLIDTECLHELSIGGAKRTRGGVAWDVDSPRSTPPGTPPPPYAIPPAPGGGAAPDEISDITPDDTDKAGDGGVMMDGVMMSPPGSVQPPIISMEDDDMSDQEISQLEDHGPFKSLNKLWAHHAHLAVFMNYVISNSDPSSLVSVIHSKNE
ncbi:delphilin-like isoform X2 [Nilaparvata lugens]|uniref:delphilin-like isoform X2 n=1 Tax=Nilaparvata lugens TaxID=108931 RepID=UPI00193E5C37|nr:delphilin-like isoform X2 [Nilaparvata lugens]